MFLLTWPDCLSAQSLTIKKVLKLLKAKQLLMYCFHYEDISCFPITYCTNVGECVL